ncbi:hypothetical protein LXL04_019784 [Taraxacum kok-saghyz]
MVNSPKGSVLLRSVDVSDVSKDAAMLFRVLDHMVEAVGEENVVQVVTDNAVAYVKGGRFLEAKRQYLYWTPSVEHCLDLISEKIGKEIPKPCSCYELDEEVYKRKELAVASCNKMWHIRHHPCLNPQIMKQLEEYDWEKLKWSSKDLMAIKKGRNYFMQKTFGRNAIDRAKEAICDIFSNSEDYKASFKIIDHRWECQLHKPLHVAGHFLNPMIFYHDGSGFAKVENGLYDCIMRLVPDHEKLDKYRNPKNYSVFLWILGTAEQKHPIKIGGHRMDLRRLF